MKQKELMLFGDHYELPVVVITLGCASNGVNLTTASDIMLQLGNDSNNTLRCKMNVFLVVLWIFTIFKDVFPSFRC